jgi:hypothetical protein
MAIFSVDVQAESLASCDFYLDSPRPIDAGSDAFSVTSARSARRMR